MITATWLTTKDNPYDYFDDFDNWYQFDVSHGYDTCGKIMREAHYTSEVPPAYNKAAIDDAIEQILKFDFEKNYVKVTKEVDETFYDV